MTQSRIPTLLHRRGLERLLRRLVSHPSRPGILYVHYWPAARFNPPFMNEEELTDTVLKYYGIPTLSMKSAVHRLLSEQPQLLDQLWWPPPDPKIHPTCIGARSVHPFTSDALPNVQAATEPRLALVSAFEHCKHSI